VVVSATVVQGGGVVEEVVVGDVGGAVDDALPSARLQPATTMHTMKTATRDLIRPSTFECSPSDPTDIHPTLYVLDPVPVSETLQAAWPPHADQQIRNTNAHSSNVRFRHFEERFRADRLGSVDKQRLDDGGDLIASFGVDAAETVDEAFPVDGPD
jgi:hypothetical protein